MEDSANQVFYALCRQAAAEGAVLLRNREESLPIRENEVVSVFGRCQIDTYRSGTGSGGAVVPPYTVSILEGIRNAKSVKINEDLAALYEAWVAEHPVDNGGGAWAAEPWFQEDMVLTDEIVSRAAAQSDKAVFIVGRTAGEDKDNAPVPGSYHLTAEETENLRVIGRHFSRIIFMANTSNLIDLSLMEGEFAEQVTAILYVWHGGMEGGNAVADLLSGAVSPSGKLTATAAYAISDYPSDRNFGDPAGNFYEEDIYVGYRYFETFAPERVQFPFGFGLSYTSFAMEPLSAQWSGNRVSVRVAVRNVGQEFGGREVVQVYARAPQGRLGKPDKVLLGFAKTGLLLPGESCEVEVSFPVSRLASFDDSGLSGFAFASVLEAGEYEILVGDCVRHTVAVQVSAGGFFIAETMVVESLRSAMAPSESFRRMRPGERRGEVFDPESEEVPLCLYDLGARVAEEAPAALPLSRPRPRPELGDREIVLQDVREGLASLEDFVASLRLEDLMVLVRGEGMGNRRVTPGTAAAFGGLSDALMQKGIPAACCADGPSGARVESGIKTTLMPIGTALASTFDTELAERLYACEGRELYRLQVDTLLGPGMNIQRHPNNGRNFEYFSEDPVVTGTFAAAVLRGLRRGGVEGTAKHFACNNQETNRNDCNAVVSERALREIYLKGFEIAVREGGCRSIMTSYNPVNGHWSASNFDLNTSILRKEWGFTGIVMTDWWAKMNDTIHRGPASHKDTASMVRAQNDLYMVVGNDGAAVNLFDDNLAEAYASGVLSLGQLQRAAVNICRFLLDTQAMSRGVSFERDIPAFAPTLSSPEATPDIPHSSADGDGIILLHPAELRKTDASEEKIDIWLRFFKAGDYNISVSAGYDRPAIHQSSCNLLLNEDFVTNYQLNGTEGEVLSQSIATVRLEAGDYLLRIDPVKPGLTLHTVSFAFQRAKPVSERLGFSTLGCPDWSFEQIVENASVMGFSAVEIRGVGEVLRTEDIPAFSEENRAATQKLLSDKRIRICGVGTSCAFHDAVGFDAAVEEGRSAIDLCYKQGIPAIRVFGNNIPQGEDPQRVIDRVVDGIRTLCEYSNATTGGAVQVWLEVHGDFHTAETLGILSDRLATYVNYGLIWDIQHTYDVYGDDPTPFFEALKTRIRHVHFKDCILVDGKPTLAAPGQGTLPLDRYMRILEDGGYTGYYSFEWEKRWIRSLAEPEEVFPRYVARMAELTKTTKD